MTNVNDGTVTRRIKWRPALLLVFIAQLVLVLTPLLEGRDGPDARAHVEEAGIRIHHAHDEAYCSACTVRHLLASSAVLPPDEIEIVHAEKTGVVERTESLRAVASSTTRSRAPPAQI
jgi:hypothetical protein